MKIKQSFWYLALSFSVTSFWSCNPSKDAEFSKKLSSNEIAVLRNSNPDISSFREVTKKQTQGIVYNKYNLSKVDFAYIKRKSKTATNMKELVAVYKKAGMTNASEYILLSMRTLYHLSNIKQAEPRVNEMTREEFSQLINGELSRDSANIVDPKEYSLFKRKSKI